MLDEMRALGEELDLKPIIRSYVDSIGKVHAKFREVVRSDLTTWDASIFDILAKYEVVDTRKEPAGLAIVLEADDGTWTEIVSIFSDFINHRKTLEHRNRVPTAFSRFFITSQVEADITELGRIAWEASHTTARAVVSPPSPTPVVPPSTPPPI